MTKPLFSLTAPLTGAILSNLDSRSLCRVATVSKGGREAAQTDRLWTVHVSRHFYEGDPIPPSITEKFRDRMKDCFKTLTESKWYTYFVFHSGDLDNAFIDEGKFYCLANKARTLVIYDPVSGKIEQSTFGGVIEAANSKFLVVTQVNGKIQILDAKTQKRMHTLEHPYGVFSIDHQHLLASSEDKTSLIDCQTGEEVRSFEGSRCNLLTRCWIGVKPAGQTHLKLYDRNTFQCAHTIPYPSGIDGTYHIYRMSANDTDLFFTLRDDDDNDYSYKYCFETQEILIFNEFVAASGERFLRYDGKLNNGLLLALNPIFRGAIYGHEAVFVSGSNACAVNFAATRKDVIDHFITRCADISLRDPETRFGDNRPMKLDRLWRRLQSMKGILPENLELSDDTKLDSLFPLLCSQATL